MCKVSDTTGAHHLYVCTCSAAADANYVCLGSDAADAYCLYVCLGSDAADESGRASATSAVLEGAEREAACHEAAGTREAAVDRSQG